MAIGRGRDRAERDAIRVNDRGAFETSFAPIHRAFGSFLAATRSFGDAAVDGHLAELQADHPIVGIEHHLPQSVHHPAVDPLVAPATQRGSRTPLIGDPLVGAAEDQHLHQLLEDRLVRYARSVAAEWMVRPTRGQQCDELLPDGLDDVWRERGHGQPPSRREV